MCERQLGTAFDCCPIVGDAQLGNGIQEMVSRLQNTHVLWFAKRAQAETHRLDEGQRIPRVHHIVQTRHPGSSEFSTEKVEILDIGRSAKYQKFQVTTLAIVAELPNGTVSIVYFHRYAVVSTRIERSYRPRLSLQTITTHRNAIAEQFDGIVVTDAFPYAARVPIASRIQRMVLEPHDRHDRRQFRVQ